MEPSGAVIPSPPISAEPRRRKFLIPAVAALLVIVLAVGWWLARHRTSRPAAAEGHKSLAVLYFSNLSQDPSLDWLNRGLTEMLTTNLAQVKGLDVLSTERILAEIQRLGKKEATELDPASAMEVARNTDADAFITGTLLRVGPKQLRLDVQVQDTKSGQILFSDKVEAPDVQGIFSMVDAVTGRVAQRFVPAANMATNAPSIEEAATSNLEAYRHYQLGVDLAHRFLIAEAVHEMEEAVRLDPAIRAGLLAACRGLRSPWAIFAKARNFGRRSNNYSPACRAKTCWSSRRKRLFEPETTRGGIRFWNHFSRSFPARTTPARSWRNRCFPQASRTAPSPC